MLLRILLILFFASVMTLFAQSPVATPTGRGSDLPPIEAGVSQELAKWRAAHYSDVRYKLNLTLEKMSPVLKGTMEIRVKVGEKRSGGVGESEPGAVATGLLPPIILDWRKIRGNESLSTISNVSLNGFQLHQQPLVLHVGPPRRYYDEQNEHLIFRDGVIAGENVIKFDFTSPILTSGSAITRYVDKEDGAEYIYSLFVPSDASTAFPVFDQPDLKARFKLDLYLPGVWKAISNEKWDGMITVRQCESLPSKNAKAEYPPDCGNNIGFEETRPISTYVFAFAAGPFERVSVPPALAGGKMVDGSQASGKSETSPSADAGGTDPGKTRKVKPEIIEAYRNWAKAVPPAVVATNIYVRKSQAEKFKPHAAEVFRLNREAVKYFEEYFDYKFPFPKYDLVLIPEFPFGGMEHAGATFLRESAIIFPQEPTKNDHISRAVLIFHEAAHQWFGDTVTMRWFDDLWLKEGFANFAAYKAMEKIMPEANAWKVFYERVKQAAYQTDSTKGTTPIYQEIKNLSAAKSAYGNIVYNKAPAFLRQAEFHLGEENFRSGVRTFLKKHEYRNAAWPDLIDEFTRTYALKKGVEESKLLPDDKKRLSDAMAASRHWAKGWVQDRGVMIMKVGILDDDTEVEYGSPPQIKVKIGVIAVPSVEGGAFPLVNTKFLIRTPTKDEVLAVPLWNVPVQPEEKYAGTSVYFDYGDPNLKGNRSNGPRPRPEFIFPNYGDYGYGIFLLDDKSRDYVLKNIRREKDPFLRSMMWGSLWDSVREGELDPKEYVELVVRVLSTTPSAEAAATPPNQGGESDESTIATLLNRTSTALNYYLTEAQRSKYAPIVEEMILQRLQNAETMGQRITYYRAFLNIAASENARGVLKKMLADADKSVPLALASGKVQTTGNVGETSPPANAGGTDLRGKLPLKTKDKFDIVTKLLILGDADAPKLLAELEKAETSDEAKRYAYAARAGIATAENKAKYWNDFVNNKEISESWIEAAFGPWNSIKHNEMTLPYLQKALQELPNHKRSRKIFFVNGWLGAFIGGQRSEEALATVNKFLADNPNLDRDLRLKILENVDVIERAVKIRAKYSRQ